MLITNAANTVGRIRYAIRGLSDSTELVDHYHRKRITHDKMQSLTGSSCLIRSAAPARHLGVLEVGAGLSRTPMPASATSRRLARRAIADRRRS
jgi:hypothetical protein